MHRRPPRAPRRGYYAAQQLLTRAAGWEGREATPENGFPRHGVLVSERPGVERLLGGTAPLRF